MIRTILRNIAIIALQLLLFNQLHLLGVCHPYPYILCLMLMPTKRSVILDMFIAAALGLMMDAFLGCWGVHMAACVAMAYLRRFLMEGDDTDSDYLSWQRVTLLSFFHHGIVFFLSAWSFRLMGWSALETLVSASITILLILFYKLMEQQSVQNYG